MLSLWLVETYSGGEIVEVSRRIQELRTKNGLSQESLAEHLGVTRQSVSKWELGQAMPDVEKILQLSRLFGVSTDSILTDASPITTPHNSQRLHFGMYLISKSFDRSIKFYEKLLQMPASSVTPNRFAQFIFDGRCMSVMNEAHLQGHDYTGHGDHKFVLNFWIPDLNQEFERVRSLNIGKTTSIIQAYPGYNFFNVYDPDLNVIEITGGI